MDSEKFNKLSLLNVREIFKNNLEMRNASFLKANILNVFEIHSILESIFTRLECHFDRKLQVIFF